MLSGCTVSPWSKDHLGSSDQEASLSAGKNAGVILVPYCTWKCVLTAISGGVYSRGPWVSFVADEFLMRVPKITSRIDVS